MIVPTVILVTGVNMVYLETEIDKIEGMVRETEQADGSGCRATFSLHRTRINSSQRTALRLHRTRSPTGRSSQEGEPPTYGTRTEIWAEVTLTCDDAQLRCRVTITPDDKDPPIVPQGNVYGAKVIQALGTYTQQGQMIDKLVKEIIRSVQMCGGWAEIEDLQSEGEKCPYCGAVYKYSENDYTEEYLVTCKNCSRMFDTTMRFVDVPEKGQAKIRVRCPFCRATYSYT
jgi:uncharacterized Zn-finger protein